jgi:uncharacterized protein
MNWDGFQEVEVIGVRVEMPSNQPIMLLKEKTGIRYLPLWIGAVEATAIAFAQQGMSSPRPLTHELLLTILGHLQGELERVAVVNLQDGIFIAELEIKTNSGEVSISARPSDAVALALRAGRPIFVANTLLAEAGVELPASDGDNAPEDEVEAFREFLDQINPEDFAGE